MNPYMSYPGGVPTPNPNPFMQYQNPYIKQPEPILPQMQILTAKGKASIDTLKMSPNSSVLIADETAPIVWKCVSDGLGNVTAEPYDISPHKDEKQVQDEAMSALVLDMNDRLKKLEGYYEQSITERTKSTEDERSSTERQTNQRDLGHAQKPGKPSGNDGKAVGK